ncbi:cytochrome P450 [Actibacterium sp. 188UL27-1]|uniref:cytochrome P450 n=1 Tax=Actibacterium sp. 188UL27-1 TaxID=2786961 RepID=UPI00195E7921|nr:cytochrome P450 [Actibacterium sp. 188UL27-1]MBM7069782.1 cytochrome P450 [Actibacterium sp. 188UL27-1]
MNTEYPLPVRATLADQPAGLLASYAQSQQNLLRLIPKAALEKPIISGVTATRWHMVMDPGAIRRILQARVEDYPKSDVARAILRPAVGDSMINVHGTEWRRQRSLAAPVFQPRHVTGLGPIMAAAADHAVERLASQTGRATNLLEEMTRATFDVIADVTFSGGQGIDRTSVQNAIAAYGVAAGKMSFLDVLGAPEWIPRPARIRPAPALQAMKDIADDSIDARRRTGHAGPPDLLDLLLEAEADGFSQTDIRDNLLAFIVAGHETTALTLAWSLYLCGGHPDIQERARSEAQWVLKGQTATAADVARLPYIRQIIDETLRLYPPAAFLSRMALEPDQILGSQVLHGDTLTIPVYAVHRHRALWDHPDRFDPDRFADPKSIPRYTYLPFGDGPRICIGARFAVQEAVIILATLLARYRFEPVPGKVPVPTLIITLRPEGGVWLNVSPA